MRRRYSFTCAGRRGRVRFSTTIPSWRIPIHSTGAGFQTAKQRPGVSRIRAGCPKSSRPPVLSLFGPLALRVPPQSFTNPPARHRKFARAQPGRPERIQMSSAKMARPGQQEQHRPASSSGPLGRQVHTLDLKAAFLKNTPGCGKKRTPSDLICCVSSRVRKNGRIRTRYGVSRLLHET